MTRGSWNASRRYKTTLQCRSMVSGMGRHGNERGGNWKSNRNRIDLVSRARLLLTLTAFQDFKSHNFPLSLFPSLSIKLKIANFIIREKERMTIEFFY